MWLINQTPTQNLHRQKVFSYNGRKEDRLSMNLNIFLIIFAAALFFLFIFFVIFLVLSLRKTTSKIDEIKRDQSENQALSLMQQQIGQLTQNINRQLQNMNTQFQKKQLKRKNLLNFCRLFPPFP